MKVFRPLDIYPLVMLRAAVAVAIMCSIAAYGQDQVTGVPGSPSAMRFD
jgi:hypothetical protein